MNKNMKKPRLEIVALSDYSDFSKEGKLSIVGIFDEIYAEKLPIVFGRCYLAFTIADAQPDKKIKLKISIFSEANSKVIEKETEGNIGKNGKGNFRLEIIGLPIKEYGNHKVVVSHQDKELGYTFFRVIKPGNGRKSN